METMHISEGKEGQHNSNQIRLDVAYSADRNFAPHLATSLVSLFTHNETILGKVFILSSDLKKQDFLDCGGSFLSTFSRSIQVVAVPPALVSDRHVSKHISATAYLRFHLPEFLPPETNRVLYLDCDTIIRGSLDELNKEMELRFQEDPSKKPVLATAVRESEGRHLQRFGFSDNNYFNSGVMGINIRAWRAEAISDELERVSRDLGALATWWDQDILNLVLERRWMSLGQEYNFTGKHLAAGATIAHFAGGTKPWEWGCRHPHRKEYWENRKRTAFLPFRKSGFVKFVWLTLMPRHRKKTVRRLTRRVSRLGYRLVIHAYSRISAFSRTLR